MSVLIPTVKMIGIPEIDESHQTIVHALQLLERHLRESQERRFTYQFNVDDIDSFLTIFRVCFILEEKIMYAHKFPKTNEHADKHAELLEYASNLFHQQCQKDGGLSVLTLSLLGKSFKKHVDDFDLKMASYIRNNQL